MTPFKLENRVASTARLFARHRPRAWRVLLAPVHALGLAGLALGLLVAGRAALSAAALRGGLRAARAR